LLIIFIEKKLLSFQFLLFWLKKEQIEKKFYI